MRAQHLDAFEISRQGTIAGNDSRGQRRLHLFQA
jgi:hypothetical protein